MNDEQKLRLAQVIIDYFEALPTDQQIEMPKMIGHLNKQLGFNGFKTAEPGTPVFELKDRYLLYFETLNGDRSVEVPYYKDTLNPAINFI